MSDDYDEAIKWVIQEVVDAITNNADEKCGLTDCQWESLYYTIAGTHDVEKAYKEYCEELGR